MKRLYTSVVIFLLIIFLCLWSVFYARYTSRTLISLADTLSQTYTQRGNGPETHKALDNLKEYTDNYRKKLSLITRTENINEIFCEVSRLENYLDSESDEFMSEIESIKSRAELVNYVFSFSDYQEK